ncbi:hypothetical protein [Streptococcus agalactiae]|uniref:hypothetical protein n=1 Tax=Streptococcus agalactiae TaxID=1311 RepID=UPI0005DFD597|nr:hypothetical protein [Streptococcus agalactiae]CNC26641.1 Uncharacterised protein [Streptococcus agalactiae]
MAFTSKRERIEKSLGEKIQAPTQSTKTRRAGRPPGKIKHPYTFTLKPKNREKLDLIAAAEGHSGASTFLDNWIENYKLDS